MIDKKVSDKKNNFTPGLELCKNFYWQAVRPILDTHFPNLSHSAGLLGTGSEVLGFDDEMSTDHHWGPRVTLFLDPQDRQRYSKQLYDCLANNLPYEFQGYSTNFSVPDPNDNGVQHLKKIEDGPVAHRVDCQTIKDFFAGYLNFNIETPITAADWLTIPEQKLRTLRSGAIYHDGLPEENSLSKARGRFDYYPHDLWLYLLASSWSRIGQEEHLMGRAGLVGDEIGSALIGARLVRDIMRLAFLMERAYAPYPKWFGTAFCQLDCADELMPHLENTLWAKTWQEREKHLIPAYEQMARMHNALQITQVMPEKVTDFWGRPFQAIAIHGFSERLLAEIKDTDVLQIAQKRPIGSIDHFSDSTDLLEDNARRPLLRQLY